MQIDKRFSDLEGAAALPSVNDADLHFLRWLATHTSPFGTKVEHVSIVVKRLYGRGLIDMYENQVVLCGAGWAVLFREGYPLDCGPNGRLS